MTDALTFIPLLRAIVLVLVLINLVWLVPLAIRSLARPVEGWPNAGFAIPLAGLLFGVAGMQLAELARINPLIPLLFYVASLVLLKLVHISGLIEIEARTGLTTGSLRLWRWLWRRH